MARQRAVLAGVEKTRVGYTGDEPNATYRNHGTHAEAIEILFDPDKISYCRVLEFFFQIHDPTTTLRQGGDRGASYRSAIYYVDDAQKRMALETIADVNLSGLWPGGGDGTQTCGRFLGSRARASGLLGAPSGWLYLSLSKAKLGAGKG